MEKRTIEGEPRRVLGKRLSDDSRMRKRVPRQLNSMKFSAMNDSRAFRSIRLIDMAEFTFILRA